jgi:phytoene dehydrogenase-like protein
MYALVEALAQLAEEIGVEIRCNHEVAHLGFTQDGKRVASSILQDGTELKAEHIIVNADAVAALAGPLFAAHPHAGTWKQRFAQREVSSSGFVELMAIDKTFADLAVHNIFFCNDYPREFKEIFSDPQALTAPTLYLSRPCAMDPTQAPKGQESWFVLVNAPSLDRFNRWPADYGDLLKNMLIDRMTGLQDANILWRTSLPPTFLQTQYNAWHGSIYGLSSNRTQDAFFRVGNRSAIKGLAFAGGSAHPGGGIPLVLLSGKMAAEALS